MSLREPQKTGRSVPMSLRGPQKTGRSVPMSLRGPERSLAVKPVWTVSPWILMSRQPHRVIAGRGLTSEYKRKSRYLSTVIQQTSRPLATSGPEATSGPVKSSAVATAPSKPLSNVKKKLRLTRLFLCQICQSYDVQTVSLSNMSELRRPDCLSVKYVRIQTDQNISVNMTELKLMRLSLYQYSRIKTD